MPRKYKQDSQGRLVHRKVMEEYIGRKLTKDEQVHHINGNRFDNRIENLQIVTQAEHDLMHKWKYSRTKVCVICGKEFEPYESKRKVGKVCSHKCKLALDKINANKRKITIIQKDLSGNFVKEWASARDAQIELGVFESNINKCCKGKIRSYKGYVWIYKDQETR